MAEPRLDGLDVHRDSYCCVCGPVLSPSNLGGQRTRLTTHDFLKHLFSCKHLQRCCMLAKWPTMFRQVRIQGVPPAQESSRGSSSSPSSININVPPPPRPPNPPPPPAAASTGPVFSTSLPGSAAAAEGTPSRASTGSHVYQAATAAAADAGYLEQYAYPEFAPRIRTFKETYLVGFHSRPGKHLKGLLSLEDFRSPTSFRDVYRCPDCAQCFSGLNTLVNHFRETLHCMMQCAECDKIIYPWLGAHPQSRFITPALHTKKDKHVGIRRVALAAPSAVVRFREHTQFRATDSKRELLTVLEQYECPGQGCKRVYRTPLSMLLHLSSNEPCCSPKIRSFNVKTPLKDLEVKCNMCDRKGSPKQMHTHYLETVDFATPHDSFTIPHEMELLYDLLVPDPVLSDYPAPKLVDAFQCSQCALIFPTWPELRAHMLETRHGTATCGFVTSNGAPCDTMIVRDEYGQIFPIHHKHHELEPRAKLIGNPNIVSNENFNRVFVDHTKVDFPIQPSASAIEFAAMCANTDPEVTGFNNLPRALVEQRATANNMNRLLYQCSSPGCYQVFSVDTLLQEHLYYSGHGSWVCPDPGCANDDPLLAWLMHSPVKHQPQRKCQHLIPTNHHLADKQHPDDFIVTFACSHLIDRFPSKFSKCAQCGFALDSQVDEHHVSSGECMNYQLTGRVTLQHVQSSRHWDGVTGMAEAGLVGPAHLLAEREHLLLDTKTTTTPIGSRVGVGGGRGGGTPLETTGPTSFQAARGEFEEEEGEDGDGIGAGGENFDDTKTECGATLKEIREMEARMADFTA